MKLQTRAALYTVTAVYAGWNAQPPFDKVALLALLLVVPAGLVAMWREEENE